MSASSKKKLRKEQNAALLTEKQKKAQAESKKLKAYSTIFTVIIVAILVTALVVIGISTYNKMGIAQKNTIAATIDGVELNSVEMNYFFVDAIENEYKSWEEMYGGNVSGIATLMGLDTSTPLDEQIYNEATGETWADYFYALALEEAKSIYALEKEAKAVGFTLTAEEQNAIDLSMEQMKLYMAASGYNNMGQFLSATYGPGASEQTYRAYTERAILAGNYYNAKVSGFAYSEDDIRAKDNEDLQHYNSYNYNTVYLSYSSYLEGGTTDENGTVTYTEADRNAARNKAKADAETLGAATSLEELDKAIAALPVNAEKENAASNKVENALYDNLPTDAAEWFTDPARKEGDITVLPLKSSTTAEDGSVTEVINGYYVYCYQSSTDNKVPMGDVRHLLVAFQSATGDVEYTDEEKATAKASAEELLNNWMSGEATEESFIALVQEKSDDVGSKADGGLFENVAPVQGVYEENFTNWAVDPNRKAGETGIIETSYGYHVMYYVGNSKLNYRDHLIETDLRNTDVSTWYTGLIDATTATKGDTSKVVTDRIVSG